MGPTLEALFGFRYGVAVVGVVIMESCGVNLSKDGVERWLKYVVWLR